jgi:hypothetical protein
MLKDSLSKGIEYTSLYKLFNLYNILGNIEIFEVKMIFGFEI